MYGSTAVLSESQGAHLKPESLAPQVEWAMGCTTCLGVYYNSGCVMRQLACILVFWGWVVSRDAVLWLLGEGVGSRQTA